MVSTETEHSPGSTSNTNEYESNEMTGTHDREPPRTEADEPFRVMRTRTDMGMTRMNEGGDTARDEARPSADHLARYRRSYRLTTDRPERFYWLWQEALAHALLLEQQAERAYPEQDGLTAL